MLRFWREFIILILAATCLYLYNMPEPDCPIIANKQHNDDVQQKVDTIQKVVTIITEPDGTTTKKIVTTDKTIKVSEKSADKDTVVPTSDLGAGRLTRYDVHLSRPISFDGANHKYDYQIGVGARIGDLPLFGTVDYRWQTRELMMGARLEW